MTGPPAAADVPVRQRCARHSSSVAACQDCQQARRDYMRDYRTRYRKRSYVLVPVELLTAAASQVDPPTAEALRALLGGSS